MKAKYFCQIIFLSILMIFGLGLKANAQDNSVRGSFSEPTGLDTEVDPIDYRNGPEDATMRKTPGLNKYPNVPMQKTNSQYYNNSPYGSYMMPSSNNSQMPMGANPQGTMGPPPQQGMMMGPPPQQGMMGPPPQQGMMGPPQGTMQNNSNIAPVDSSTVRVMPSPR